MIRSFASKLEDGSYETGAFCLLSNIESKRFNVMVDKLHGKVIRVFERNYYDDSDFIATIWNDETNRPENVLYATTRAYSYPCIAIVDATDEVLEKYKDYQASATLAWQEYEQKKQAYIPKIGCLAKSLTKKGKAKGLQGTITWVGSSPYSNKAVKIDGIFVDAEKIEIWHDELEQWVSPARWSNSFGWCIPETVLETPVFNNI